MLAASPAQGEVVFTPTKVTVSLRGNSLYELNPAGSQVAPFLLIAGFTSPGAYWDTISFNPRTSGARFVQGPGTSWSIAPLKKGSLIGPARRFGGGLRGFAATIGPYGSGTYNNHDGFKFGEPTYIGFKFLIAGQTHYGWARLTVRYNPNTPKQRLGAELTGYAYETVAGQPIKAGQTSGALSSMDSQEPMAGSMADDFRAASAPAASDRFLGLLALGAVGLPAWRREL